MALTDEQRLDTFDELSYHVSPSGLQQRTARSARLWQLATIVLGAVVIALAVALAVVVVEGDGGSNESASAADSSSLLSSSDSLTMLVVGDWGRQGPGQDPDAMVNQTRVAEAMGLSAAQALERGDALAVVSVGDNFYDDGLAHCDDPNFEASYSNVYNHPALQDTQWDVILGNHDYHGNVTCQKDSHARRRDSRWNLQLGTRKVYKSKDGKTIIHGIFLDTNPLISAYVFCPGPKHTYHFESVHFPSYEDAPVSYSAARSRALSDFNQLVADAAAARDSVEMEGGDITAWLFVFGHHPIRSNTHHLSEIDLLNDIDPILWKHGVDVYINGHEHDLQHIQRPFCCAYDGDGGAGVNVTTFENRDFDEQSKCDVTRAPKLKYIGRASAPYTGRALHYITTGAGGETREKGHPNDIPTDQELARHGDYYHPGPGFVSFHASGSALNMTFIVREGEVAHTFSLSK